MEVVLHFRTAGMVCLWTTNQRLQAMRPWHQRINCLEAVQLWLSNSHLGLIVLPCHYGTSNREEDRGGFISEMDVAQPRSLRSGPCLLCCSIIRIRFFCQFTYICC